MITVHHLENSRSQRILWMLEELELEYEVIRYDRDKKTSLAPESLKKIHPLGKSPVITDGDQVVAETGAIIEYILERHAGGRMLPAAGTPEHLEYRYWLHAGEGSVMPLLVMTLILGRIDTAVPWPIKPIAWAITAQVRSGYVGPTLEANLAHMEETLSRQPWFAGAEMTGADIQMSFPIEAAASRAGLGEKYPHLQAYLERIQARPAYRKALERGGPYDLMS